MLLRAAKVFPERLAQPVGQGRERFGALFPRLVVTLLVRLFGGVDRRLHRAQQCVGQNVVQPESLVDDEGDQMQMAVGGVAPRHLGDAGLEHRVGIVADRLRV